jgi:hypothetical protein
VDARRENVRFLTQPISRSESGKRFPNVLFLLCQFEKNRRHKTSHCAANEHLSLQIGNNSMQKFFKSHETFVWGASSIRVQPERRAALGSQRSSRKTPRWQPRGRDTHSFRPLVQEEKVSFGEIYSSPCPRVNLCLASSRKSAADSILRWKR